MSRQLATVASKPTVQVEIITYAPTEFYHCQHCEIVWNHLDFGHRLHAEQRSGLLPPDLEAEYRSISDWADEAFARYGDRVTIKIVDAVSIEGFVKSLLHRSRRFPLFILGGVERLPGFDPEELNRALQRRLGWPEQPANREVTLA